MSDWPVGSLLPVVLFAIVHNGMDTAKKLIRMAELYFCQEEILEVDKLTELNIPALLAEKVSVEPTRVGGVSPKIPSSRDKSPKSCWIRASSVVSLQKKRRTEGFAQRRPLTRSPFFQWKHWSVIPRSLSLHKSKFRGRSTFFFLTLWKFGGLSPNFGPVGTEDYRSYSKYNHSIDYYQFFRPRGTSLSGKTRPPELDGIANDFVQKSLLQMLLWLQDNIFLISFQFFDLA